MNGSPGIGIAAGGSDFRLWIIARWAPIGANEVIGSSIKGVGAEIA